MAVLFVYTIPVAAGSARFVVWLERRFRVSPMATLVIFPCIIVPACIPLAILMQHMAIVMRLEG